MLAHLIALAASLVEEIALRGKPEDSRFGDYTHSWPSIHAATAFPSTEDSVQGNIRAFTAWSASIIRRDEQPKHFTERVVLVTTDAIHETMELWLLWPSAGQAEFVSCSYVLKDVFSLLEAAESGDTQRDRWVARGQLLGIFSPIWQMLAVDHMPDEFGYYTPNELDIESLIGKLKEARQ